MNIWDTLMEALEGKTEISIDAMEIADTMRGLGIVQFMQVSTYS